MTVTQIYTLMNTVTSEVLGAEAVVSENLSNVVDIGEAIFNANAVDNYVKSLVNHIGKVIFVNRKYAGSAPSVLMDGWEYGAVLEKISAELQGQGLAHGEKAPRGGKIESGDQPSRDQSSRSQSQEEK